jgi:GAF domain-containing protein/HAMP domain-containing protein
MRFLEFIKKLKLSTKLNLLAFLLFGFLLLGMVLTINKSMDNFVLQAGRQNVIQDAQTIQIRFDEIKQENLNNTLSLAETPGLRLAISEVNIRPIETELLITAARLGFDDMDLLDAKGRHLLGRIDSASLEEDRLTRLALLGFDATGLVVNKAKTSISITAVVPIYDESGVIVGAMLGSRVIDNKMLSQINISSGQNLDLVLVVNGMVVASDFEKDQSMDYFLPYLLDANSLKQALNGQTIVYEKGIISSTGVTPHILGHTPLTVGGKTQAVIGLAVNMSELANVKGNLISNQRNVLILFAIVSSILLALFTVFWISNPLQRLTQAAERLTSGNYTERVVVSTKDELWELANAFNRMATQIQELVANLEKRVAERTSELENRRLELEKISQESRKRANELRAAAEIGQYLSTEKELEFLLPLITRTVSERFGFYHVGIFLLNENGQFAVLRAANSPGGQKMLARGHRLEVGQVGIVGRVTSTGSPRIALDTGSDAVYFNNPDLPETHSEMALPLIARGQIIGALDVQSTVPNAFTEQDVSTLSLLADQIAIAIDNVRLLKEAQNALEESRAVVREYLADAWQKKSTSEILGYYQTLTGGQVITGGKDETEIDIPVDGENMLTMPIKLRDQVIGTLNIRPNNNKAWTADEVNIAQAVSERLGLALDNARLFEETTRRAEREHLVSEITTKIRSTTDPQEMVKTAVEELKRALGVNRIEIAPQKNASSSDNKGR